MDTSPEYIKQCEEAEEIQGFWQPSHGDYYWGNNSIERDEYLTDKRFYNVHLVADFDSEGGWFHLEPEHIDKSRHTFLPRQDQLQDLLRGDGTLSNPRRTAQVLFSDLVFFLKRLAPEVWASLGSGEKLWLAFVMSERFNKIWLIGKEDWVKIPVEVKNAS